MNKFEYHKHVLFAADLNPTEKLCALALCHYAGRDLTGARPSNETLALCMGCTVSTVTRTVRSLKAKGWIVPTRNNRGGNGRANEWTLTVPTTYAPMPRLRNTRAEATSAPETVNLSTHAERSGGDQGDNQGENSTTEKEREYEDGRNVGGESAAILSSPSFDDEKWLAGGWASRQPPDLSR